MKRRNHPLALGLIGLVVSAGMTLSAAAFPGSSNRAYGPAEDEPFPVPALDVSKLNPTYRRTVVRLDTTESPGTIIIDPAHHYLYVIEEGGRAIRYGVGVGRQGFAWSGTATIRSKQEWPDWYPPKEMLEMQPQLLKAVQTLQSGIGMPGGPRNPLGARALYLWQGNKDTLYRSTARLSLGRSVRMSPRAASG